MYRKTRIYLHNYYYFGNADYCSRDWCNGLRETHRKRLRSTGTTNARAVSANGGDATTANARHHPDGRGHCHSTGAGTRTTAKWRRAAAAANSIFMVDISEYTDPEWHSTAGKVVSS